jgi:RimJ/RimL family protein N-acetyltransferase
LLVVLYLESVTWQPMSLTIETERLTLRLRDERDAAWYRELVGERGEAMPTLDEATTRLARFRDLTIELGIGALAICRREEGDVIGYCALVVGRCSLDEPEIAYELLRRFHGRGYATEAAQALVAAAAATGRHRLWSTVRPSNAASLRVLEKIGFRWDHTSTDDLGDVVYLVRDLYAPGRAERRRHSFRAQCAAWITPQTIRTTTAMTPPIKPSPTMVLM